MRKFKNSQEFAHKIKRDAARKFWGDVEKLQKARSKAR